MKGEIYNFVFFSEIGSGNVADKNFFVNWGQMPESQYKLTFSFVSSTLAVAPTFEAMLFINEIGCSNNIVCNGQFAFQGYSGGYIGILRDNVNELFLGSSINDNPPSFLRARPSSNQINVKIHRNNASLGTDYAPLPAKYTLVLSFEQLDD